MIEQMLRIIAKVLLNKEEGKYEEAIKDIETSFGKLLATNAKRKRLPSKSLK